MRVTLKMNGDGEPSEGGSSEADKDIDDYEEQECNHDISFSHHKQLSCDPQIFIHPSEQLEWQTEL